MAQAATDSASGASSPLTTWYSAASAAFARRTASVSPLATTCSTVSHSRCMRAAPRMRQLVRNGPTAPARGLGVAGRRGVGDRQQLPRRARDERAHELANHRRAVLRIERAQSLERAAVDRGLGRGLGLARDDLARLAKALAQHLPERQQLERLRDVAVHPGLDAGAARRRHRVRGQRDDRYARPRARASPRLRIAAVASIPSTFGMCSPISTRSNGSASSAAIASAPSPATSTC